jgi:hypothetical protein
VFLLDAHIPYLGTIREHGYNQGIEDPSPVYEVKASDRVAQDTDASDGGAGSVYHKVCMCVPSEFRHDVYTQVAEGCRDGGDALVVGVYDTVDVSPDEIGVGSAGCENR